MASESTLMAEEKPPEPPPESLANALNTAMMRHFMAMPAALEAIVEGESGAELPPEEAAEAYLTAIPILIRHLQALAYEVDVLRGVVARLEDQAPRDKPKAE